MVWTIIGSAIIWGLWLSGTLMTLIAHRAWRSGEPRATRIAALAALALLALWAMGRWLGIQPHLAGLALLATALAIALSWPIGRLPPTVERPQGRVDERDIPFARMRMTPGSDNYVNYYAAHPERQPVDEAIRRLPGLLSPDATQADERAFAATDASFAFIDGIRHLAGSDEASAGPHGDSPSDAAANAAWIKRLARHYGAHDAGIARLQPYHIYSHIGRGPGEWGAAIALPHPYAIAFTVEMREAMIRQGPGAGAIMESSRAYAEAAHIALQLAAYIRRTGYAARAHIDGSYRVLCPLVARDAGLGEIGRMSYLITPQLGPRVRIAVVTTDLPLAPGTYQPDMSVIDLCRICLKCADCCPANAVPDGDRQRYDGALRWRIDADACFRYWNQAGTDCGRCMAVCPYSHSALYGLPGMSALLRHAGLARRAFLWLDDRLYGAKPKPHPPSLG